MINNEPVFGPGLCIVNERKRIPKSACSLERGELCAGKLMRFS